MHKKSDYKIKQQDMISPDYIYIVMHYIFVSEIWKLKNDRTFLKW